MIVVNPSTLVFKGDFFNPGRVTSALTLSFPQTSTSKEILFKIRTNYHEDGLSVIPSKGILNPVSVTSQQVIFIMELKGKEVDFDELRVQIVYYSSGESRLGEGSLVELWSQVPGKSVQKILLTCIMDTSCSMLDILEDDEPTPSDKIGNSTCIPEDEELILPPSLSANQTVVSDGSSMDSYRDGVIFLSGIIFVWIAPSLISRAFYISSNYVISLLL